MAIPMFDLEQIPAYHEDILILKVRSLPNAVEHMMAPEGAATTTLSSPEVTKALEGAPGLQTLSVLERADLIGQVIPLSRPAEQRVSVLGEGQEEDIVNILLRVVWVHLSQKTS